MLVFGVGCVVFAYDKENSDPKKFDLISFRKDIVSAIGNLENVTNLEARNVEDLRVGFRSFEEDHEGDLLIIPCNLRLSFDLLLPNRLQSNYGAELPTETIAIDIVYGYDRPVMYCSYNIDDNEGVHSAQMTVMVVRKFLEQKLVGKIRCKSIAPSPFHANFFIKSENGKNPRLIDRSESRGGIANIEVIVTESGVTPIEQVIRAYNETFSRFYYLSTLRSRLIGQRNAIVAGISDIVDRDEEGIKARIKSLFSVRRDIDEVQRQVFHERLNRIRADDYLSEARGTDQLGAGTPLGRFFDEYGEMSRQGIWAEFAQIATFFEDRRHRVINNLSVLMAGIIGGVIGALIAGAATLYSVSGIKPAVPGDTRVADAERAGTVPDRLERPGEPTKNLLPSSAPR